jgi:hypothetical protein
MYSTPKYKANAVNVRTKQAETSPKVSKQNTKWESIRSKQKKNLPKSIK